MSLQGLGMCGDVTLKCCGVTFAGLGIQEYHVCTLSTGVGEGSGCKMMV